MSPSSLCMRVIRVTVGHDSIILLLIGGWSLIGLNEPEPWNINSTTGFIFEKLHGSGAFFDVFFSADLLNSSVWIPYVSTVCELIASAWC